MTKNEILRLEAGRELDKLIAFYIFRYGIPSNIPRDNEPYIRFRASSEIINGKADCEEILPIPLKHYSTDILAAWEVVEKVRQNNTIAIILNEDCCLCQIIKGNRYIGEAYAKNAPEAICKASLLSLCGDGGAK